MWSCNAQICLGLFFDPGRLCVRLRPRWPRPRRRMRPENVTPLAAPAEPPAGAPGVMVAAADFVVYDDGGMGCVAEWEGGAIATVASLPCREPGCPPFETFVQVLSGVTPVSFRLKKRPADVRRARRNSVAG